MEAHHSTSLQPVVHYMTSHKDQLALMLLPAKASCTNLHAWRQGRARACHDAEALSHHILMHKHQGRTEVPRVMSWPSPVQASWVTSTPGARVMPELSSTRTALASSMISSLLPDASTAPQQRCHGCSWHLVLAIAWASCARSSLLPSASAAPSNCSQTGSWSRCNHQASAALQ